MITGENMTLGLLLQGLRVTQIYSLPLQLELPSLNEGITGVQTDTNQVTVAARLAKNNVIDGPVGLSNRIKPFEASTLEAASLSLSWIFFCIPNDTISLYTSRAGAGSNTSAKTREGLSSIIIEYIGN